MKKQKRSYGNVTVNAGGVKWKLRMTKSSLEVRKHYGRQKNVIFLPLADLVEFAAGQRLLRL